MRKDMIAAGILVIFIALAGCTGQQASSSYSVDSRGILSVSCAPATTSEEILFKNDTYTKTRIVQQTQKGDVVTYLAAPQNPKAAIVYVPGAGEKPSGHEERMVEYARAGYAFLFVDIRGNGGETPGYTFNPQKDFSLFEKDDWPQYYMTVCDLVVSQDMLSRRFGIPVYAMGSSNGGRYAAVAAGVDPAFAGYVGISTSDWGIQDAVIRQGNTGNLVRFAASIEPGTYFAKISPRPVWIFHAVDDPVIPFEDGKELFERAGEPKTFIEFSGGHGINADVDDRIIMQWAQIYGTRE
ncbi:MAG TPA: alpha/beta hydrolase [Methanoregula sp.]|nr:alpha/beta hydrolase [Methanoregula sp.]